MFFAVLVQPILAQGFDHPQLIKTLKDLVPSCNNFSSLWIRAAFHDAGTFMRGGGLDGSLLFEIDRPENKGLDSTIHFYQGLKQTYKVSLADIIAYSAKLAVESCIPGTTMDFKAGRVDATTANPTGRLPTIKFVANDIRNKFVNDYGLSVRHTVALIGGAHSVAFVSQKNTPEATFNGSIDSTPHTFDNVFFTELKNRQGNKLPTDMELLKDSEMFNAICLYSKNQTLLQHEFIEAMQQLLNLGTIYKPYFTPSNQQMNPQGNYYNPFSPGNNYFPASNGKSYTPVFNGNNDQLKSNNAQTIDGLIQEGYAHNQIYGVSSENHGSLMELNHFFMFTLLFVFQ